MRFDDSIYYFYVPVNVLDLDIDANTKLVYIVLCSYTNSKTDLCYPSIQTISKKAGLSARQVIRAIKKLDSIGLIEIVQKGKGRGNKNIYRVFVPKSDNKKNAEHKKVRIPDNVKAELKQVSDELMNEVSRYISEKGIDYVMSNIRYANNNAKDNYIAYLLQALKNDWAKNIREGQDEQNKYKQASKEYKKFVGKTVLIKGVEHTIEESSIYNTKENCAIPIGDILKNWDKWHPFLEKAVASPTVDTQENTHQEEYMVDKKREIQGILNKIVLE